MFNFSTVFVTQSAQKYFSQTFLPVKILGTKITEAKKYKGPTEYRKTLIYITQWVSGIKRKFQEQQKLMYF